MSADEVIHQYNLIPHPEGGYYRETFRSPAKKGCRGRLTAIYYLLKAGEVSTWHRIDAMEMWCYHIGDNLRLDLSPDGIETVSQCLGTGTGTDLQVMIPAGTWQRARSVGACIVSPAFEFAGFELAPSGWYPEKQ